MADDDAEALNVAKAFTLAKYGEWKEFKEIMESDLVSASACTFTRNR
jgi:hypothetical protein